MWPGTYSSIHRYKSPRPNHLYVGLDYHMTDIQIEELIKMIPQVDSVLPMLRSFRGKGEFHLAAETNLNRDYAVKWSTLRGAASVQGKDLVLLDGETFSQIAKLMLFKKKTENKIDSISAEATVFRNEVDIFPFMVSMDKYKVALGGRHNLDMTFNYHLSLLSPLRIGVDVSGNFDDLKIKPTRCKYAEDFRPIDENCGCPVCQKYSRAYVRHLLKSQEMLSQRLLVMHNLWFYNHLMEDIRNALDNGNFAEFKKEKEIIYSKRI